VAVYLFLPIIILEDVSLPKAVGRAKEIHARNLIPIAMAEVGVLVVNRIVGFVALLPAVAGVGFIWVSHPELLVPALVTAGAWLILLIAYTGFVRTAYYTCLYLWAVERAEAKELAAAPRPLAVALAA
jgi:membrane-anchored glycerophosphoryl diester phosphodiesterase (GDPDase)